MMKPKTILLIAVLLVAVTVPVLAADDGKFHISEIIQRKIVPANNAYWKVWGYNSTSGNYTLEPVRPVSWYPYWTPTGKRILMTRRFIDPRFVLKGVCGKPLVLVV